ncbi:putative thioredoxin-disulfide reductase [Rosa chinensis]|uniref:Putative thioredoxin-disulfide reductase n=1 Tax=Rosa chinensis TaxID=74649 RepID=A0A2P6RL35_ROSCH|nr:putative thioredoxin-disulfide reductase [Rosa chinensis]
MEEAMFLTKYGSEVNTIHRSDTFRASKITQNRALSNPKIKCFGILRWWRHMGKERRGFLQV